MGCCGEDKEERLTFRDGSQRSCTDLLMLLIFAAAAVGSILCFHYAIDNGGDPYLTLYGVNYRGEVCGRSAAVSHLDYAAWPIIPNTPDRAAVSDQIFEIKICVDNCDLTNTDTANFPDTYTSLKLFRYCVPTGTAIIAGGDAIIDIFSSSRETASRVISDLYTTWPVILGSVFVAILFAFIYVKCMKSECCRCVLVVGTMFLIIAGGFLCGWGLIRYANRVDDAEPALPDRAYAARVTGWVCVAFSALFLIIIFFLRKRIALAVEVIGAAACAIDQMKSIIFYPVIPFIFVCGFAVYWIWQALYLFSVKDRTDRIIPAGVGYDSVADMAGATTYASFDWNTTFQKLFAYHFFYLLWVTQFIVYAAFITMAGAVAQWFFAKPSLADRQERQVGSEPGMLPRTPVCNSIFRTIRYHLGTVAFAALIIAIIRFIRAIVTYIQRKTRDAQNPCTRCLLCCVQCCLKCCQKCLDYISRNALAWCAIRGDSFCTSGLKVFGLLASNLGKAAAMSLIGTFVLFFGALCVALITTGCAAMIIMYVWNDNELSSTVMPLVVIFVLTFVVADLFMEVFESAMDTMFLCYLADPEGAFSPAKFTAAMDHAREAHEKKEARAAAKAQARNDGGGAAVSANTATVTPYN